MNNENKKPMGYAYEKGVKESFEQNVAYMPLKILETVEIIDDIGGFDKCNGFIAKSYEDKDNNIYIIKCPVNKKQKLFECSRCHKLIFTEKPSEKCLCGEKWDGWSWINKRDSLPHDEWQYKIKIKESEITPNTIFKRVGKSNIPEVITGTIQMPIINEGSEFGRQIYENILDLLKDTLIFQNDVLYKILALWIMGTWLQNNQSDRSFKSCGIPAFLSKYPDRGKSTALSQIYKLAYRSIDKGKDTKRHLNLINKYNVTLILDNLEDYYTKEIKLFIDKSYKDDNIGNFGFIAIGGTVDLKESNMQRVIPFFMKHGKPIRDARWIDDEIYEKIRNNLYIYSMYCWMFSLNNDESWMKEGYKWNELSGRGREIFETFIIIADEIGLNYDDIIEYGLKIQDGWHKQSNLEKEIVTIIKNSNDKKVTLEHIAEKLEWIWDKTNQMRLNKALKSIKIKKHSAKHKGEKPYIDKTKNTILDELYVKYEVTSK